MFGVAMIREQLYVTEAQEEALKVQARSLGVSESGPAPGCLGGRFGEKRVEGPTR